MGEEVACGGVRQTQGQHAPAARAIPVPRDSGSGSARTHRHAGREPARGLKRTGTPRRAPTRRACCVSDLRAPLFRHRWDERMAKRRDARVTLEACEHIEFKENVRPSNGDFAHHVDQTTYAMPKPPAPEASPVQSKGNKTLGGAAGKRPRIKQDPYAAMPPQQQQQQPLPPPQSSSHDAPAYLNNDDEGGVLPSIDAPEQADIAEIRQLEKWSSGNLMNDKVFQAVLANQEYDANSKASAFEHVRGAPEIGAGVGGVGMGVGLPPRGPSPHAGAPMPPHLMAIAPPPMLAAPMMPVAYGSTEQYYPQMMGHPRPPAELSPLPTISGGYDVLPKLMKRGGGGANAPNQGATMQGIQGMMTMQGMHAGMPRGHLMHPFMQPTKGMISQLVSAPPVHPRIHPLSLCAPHTMADRASRACARTHPLPSFLPSSLSPFLLFSLPLPQILFLSACPNASKPTPVRGPGQ